MAQKIFLGLAIVAILGAAAIAYLTKGNIDQVQERLKDTKATLATTQKNLADTKATLAKTEDELKVANGMIATQKEEIAKVSGERDAEKAKVADLQTQLDAKTADLAKLKEDLEKAMGGKGGPDPALLAQQIQQLNDDLKKTQTELAEAKQVADTMTNRAKEADDKLQTANAEVERYRKNVAKQGLSGKIMAVNPGWNFVVLSVGDRQGAAVGASMIVTRGGEPIARAKITSVEPATSIADVVPGSVRPGVTVQPGDAVIYEGQRK